MGPTFFVIGAAKAATSSLCAQLAQHPDVFLTNPKEPGGFSSAYEDRWDWYMSLFEPGMGVRARGEGTVRYSQLGVYPDVAERIKKHVPDARLIYIVRHPLRRAESMWIEWRSMGHPECTPDFCETLRRAPALLDASLYWKQISAYREHFDDEQIHIEFFEDYRKDPRAVLGRCFAHIGVDPGFLIEDLEARNRSETKLVDTRLASGLRKIPLLRKVLGALPAGFHDTARRLIKSRSPGRPEWNRETLAWAIEHVRDDPRRFLELYGKPEDYWNLKAETGTGSGMKAWRSER